MNYGVVFAVIIVPLILWLGYRSYVIFREGFSTNRAGKILFLIMAFCVAAFFLIMLAIGIISGSVNNRGPITDVYRCDGGKEITVTYRKYAPSLTLSDGRYIEFSDPEYSDHGARYVNADKSVIFWVSDQNQNYLEEDGKVTYTNCRR